MPSPFSLLSLSPFTIKCYESVGRWNGTSDYMDDLKAGHACACKDEEGRGGGGKGKQGNKGRTSPL